MSAQTENVIHIEDLRKVYSSGPIQVEALKGVDLTVKSGEFMAMIGPSGSGKSTFMNILGCLDLPTSGSYKLQGEEVAGLNADQLAEVRNRRIGFVFQNFHLLPQLTAFENVELPLLFQGMKLRDRRDRVEDLLSRVGLADRMDHKPTEISGGQMQRVAIARALACKPNIILADEPTGNLDSTSGGDIVSLFEELHAEGHTLILITHDSNIAKRAERIINIQDGLIAA